MYYIGYLNTYARFCWWGEKRVRFSDIIFIDIFIFATICLFIRFCPSIVLHPSCAKENMHPRVAENKCDFLLLPLLLIYIVEIVNMCMCMCMCCVHFVFPERIWGKTNKVAIVEEIVCVHFYLCYQQCLHSFCRRVFIFA